MRCVYECVSLCARVQVCTHIYTYMYIYTHTSVCIKLIFFSLKHPFPKSPPILGIIFVNPLFSSPTPCNWKGLSSPCFVWVLTHVHSWQDVFKLNAWKKWKTDFVPFPVWVFSPVDASSLWRSAAVAAWWLTGGNGEAQGVPGVKYLVFVYPWAHYRGEKQLLKLSYGKKCLASHLICLKVKEGRCLSIWRPLALLQVLFWGEAEAVVARIIKTERQLQKHMPYA